MQCSLYVLIEQIMPIHLHSVFNNFRLLESICLLNVIRRYRRTMQCSLYVLIEQIMPIHLQRVFNDFRLLKSICRLRVRTILANQWMRLRYGVFEDPDPRRTGLRDIVELSLFMKPYVRPSVDL